MQMKKIILSLLVLFCANSVRTDAATWLNDTKEHFLNNKAVVYSVNMRTFNADDKNGNDIVEFNLKENSGNFVNGVTRLDELKSLGINTIELMPIMDVGKTKALGTAGDLFAMKSFTVLNPQLDDKTNKLTVDQEAKAFVREAHDRGIRVIVMLPAYGAYDLYNANPELFLMEKANKPVVPKNKTDVLKFKSLSANGGINEEVFDLHKRFVDKVMSLGIDGITVCDASDKPLEFWRRLIAYTKQQDPEFLFVAQKNTEHAKNSQDIEPSFDKFFDAGFDVYFGGYSNFQDWKSVSDIKKHVENIDMVLKKYNGEKAFMADFTGVNQLSPYAQGGAGLSSSIMWLNATLPVNSYYVDGFANGDMYVYRYANKRAPSTWTDSRLYYADKNKIDIYNFSRKPKGGDEELAKEFTMAAAVKVLGNEISTTGEFRPLFTGNRSVMAYARVLNKSSMILIWNTDQMNPQKVKIRLKQIGGSQSILPAKSKTPPLIDGNTLEVKLEPGEVQVLLGSNVKY